MAEPEKQTSPKGASDRRGRRSGTLSRNALTGQFMVVEAARRAGLLEGESSEHLSFRAPKPLVEAARRESGASSPTELGILALSILAQPDPVVAFMKRMRGRLGEDAGLDY